MVTRNPLAKSLSKVDLLLADSETSTAAEIAAKPEGAGQAVPWKMSNYQSALPA